MSNKFNNEVEYECCPGVKCTGFTELMYMVNNTNLIPTHQLLSLIPFHLLSVCRTSNYSSYINAKNKLGWTALMIACRNSNITSNNEIVKLLLMLGADFTITNNNSETSLTLALKYAGFGSNIKTVKILLKRWNLNDLCKNYELYFSIAWKNKLHKKDLLKILVDNYALSDKKYEIFAHIVKNSRTKRNTIILKFLSEYITNVNYTVSNECNSTPLMLACRYSSTTSDNQTIQLLLDKGANPNYLKENKYLPIILASSYSHTTSNIETIGLLLKHGANINACDAEGNTALLMAIKNSDTSSDFKTIKYLLDNGADVNIVGRFLKSPLHMVVEKYNINFDLVKLLLEHKANINFQNYEGETCLSLFAKNNYIVHHDTYKKIMELFLDHDCDLNFRTKNGETPFTKLLDLYIGIKGQSETINKIIDLFLAREIDCNSGIIPPLLKLAKYSSEFNMTDIVTKLVKYGADVNVTDSNNNTALLLATKTGKGNNMYFINLLLDLGANVNIQNMQKDTCLMSAIELNNFEMIKLFLEHGADINVINKSGDSCLLKMFCHNRIQNQNDVEIIKLLIKYGANVNFVNKYTVLSQAIDITSNFGPEVVELLLENGADPNYIYNNETVLLEILEENKKITSNNDLLYISILLKYGANPNILDKHGNNTVLLAIKNKFPLEIINLLIDNSADINVINKYKMTALMYAVEFINEDPDYCHQLVNLLLDHKINTYLCNDNGRTALIIIAKILFKSNSFNYTAHNSKLFGTNGIFTRLCECTNFEIMDMCGKTVLAYTQDEIMIDFMKLFKKKCIQDYLTKNLHLEITGSNLAFIMSPGSIRTRIATIQWYLNREKSFEELKEHDSKLFEYLGINDMDDLILKLSTISNYID
ncbi:putative ankyrin repeat protein [Acanthamoeba polyphaga mimivirus]|nr:putative ankyrin repeat protein [Mimivirus reunion]WMV61368.1 putative ankyrin repeat protein [Mimivirus sp.]WMV62345.1 putative ankyrin repeat protein [Acanthamoeba polyphaga mimivirus]WMV63322.1 putative ankyrin repeat protein [Mimivirus sp.]